MRWNSDRLRSGCSAVRLRLEDCGSGSDEGTGADRGSLRKLATKEVEAHWLPLRPLLRRPGPTTSRQFLPTGVSGGHFRPREGSRLTFQVKSTQRGEVKSSFLVTLNLSLLGIICHQRRHINTSYTYLLLIRALDQG